MHTEGKVPGSSVYKWEGTLKLYEIDHWYLLAFNDIFTFTKIVTLFFLCKTQASPS